MKWEKKLGVKERAMKDEKNEGQEKKGRRMRGRQGASEERMKGRQCTLQLPPVLLVFLKHQHNEKKGTSAKDELKDRRDGGQPERMKWEGMSA